MPRPGIQRDEALAKPDRHPNRTAVAVTGREPEQDAVEPIVETSVDHALGSPGATSRQDRIPAKVTAPPGRGP